MNSDTTLSGGVAQEQKITHLRLKRSKPAAVPESAMIDVVSGAGNWATDKLRSDQNSVFLEPPEVF